MKKLLALLGVVFVIIGLSACSVNQEFQDGPSLVSMSGVLVEQTASDKESGTHFLIDDAQKKTAVRSLTINLSGDEYLNNKVAATGVMNTSDNVFEITGLTVSSILSKNTKQNKPLEYKSTEVGIKLTYFDDWKVTTAKDKTVTFTAPLATGAKSPAVVTISQKPFVYEPKTKADGSTDSALEAYYAQEYKGKSVFAKTMLSKIGVDQMDALKNILGKTNYVLYRSGLIFNLDYTPADPSKADDENTFNKMVADFQFISIDPSAAEATSSILPIDSPVLITASDLPKLDMDMTPFESLPYQFKGQYPSKWYYAGVKSMANAEILHHYGFSDEATGTKEIISLDVLSDGIPGGGNKLTFGGKNFDVFEKGDTYTVYTTLKTRNFRIMGPSTYKDLILVMAADIDSVDTVKQP